jgi:glycosyltransferase involved in cell wall biosynthesis
MKPKVSVITVCYNAEKTIENTILSIINQSYNNIEYIIIDGKSTDNTLTLIKKYQSSIDTIISEPDKGIYDAMNKGIKKATGEIISIVNADDFLNVHSIKNVVNFYLNNNRPDIIYGNINFIKDKINFSIKPLPNIKGFNYKKMPVCHPAMFVTSELYTRVGTYDISYKNASDYEFVLRCIKEGVTFKYFNEVLSNMRAGGASENYMLSLLETKEINIKYGLNKGFANIILLYSIFKRFIKGGLFKIVNKIR